MRATGLNSWACLCPVYRRAPGHIGTPFLHHMSIINHVWDWLHEDTPDSLLSSHSTANEEQIAQAFAQVLPRATAAHGDSQTVQRVLQATLLVLSTPYGRVLQPCMPSLARWATMSQGQHSALLQVIHAKIQAQRWPSADVFRALAELPSPARGTSGAAASAASSSPRPAAPHAPQQQLASELGPSTEAVCSAARRALAIWRSEHLPLLQRGSRATRRHAVSLVIDAQRWPTVQMCTRAATFLDNALVAAGARQADAAAKASSAGVKRPRLQLVPEDYRVSSSSSSSSGGCNMLSDLSDGAFGGSSDDAGPSSPAGAAPASVAGPDSSDWESDSHVSADEAKPSPVSETRPARAGCAASVQHATGATLGSSTVSSSSSVAAGLKQALQAQQTRIQAELSVPQQFQGLSARLSEDSRAVLAAWVRLLKVSLACAAGILSKMHA